MGVHCSCLEETRARKDAESSLDEPVAVNDEKPLSPPLIEKQLSPFMQSQLGLADSGHVENPCEVAADVTASSALDELPLEFAADASCVAELASVEEAAGGDKAAIEVNAVEVGDAEFSNGDFDSLGEAAGIKEVEVEEGDNVAARQQAKTAPLTEAKFIEYFEKASKRKSQLCSEDTKVRSSTRSLEALPKVRTSRSLEALPKVGDQPVRTAADVRQALKVLCQRHGLCCSIVYKLDKSTSLLYVDKGESYDGAAPDFYQKSLSCSGTQRIGEGIVGRAWAKKGRELVPNVRILDEKVFPRKDIALVTNICTVFAIYHQEAVYEFDTSNQLNKFPFETVDIDEIVAESIESKRKHQEARRARQQSCEHLRPTVEDLEAHCVKYSLCCCVVWKAQAGLLVVDQEESFKGTAGEFVERSEILKLKIGQGLAGRVWESKAFEHRSNVLSMSNSAYTRRSIAKLHNIKTVFGIFVQDRVYEFNSTNELASPPFTTLEVAPFPP